MLLLAATSVGGVIGGLVAQEQFTTALTVLTGCAAFGILTAVLLPTPAAPAKTRTPTETSASVDQTGEVQART